MAPELLAARLARVLRRWTETPPAGPEIRGGAALPVRSAAHSHPGSYPANQDAVGEERVGDLTLFLVADGLGAHAGGREASAAAVEAARAAFRAQPSLEAGALEALVLAADQAVARTAASEPSLEGARSTLVALALRRGQARWAHVGDSRLYHLRSGRVLSRTRDHSVPEVLFRAGEIGEGEIRGHADRNRLLQALGHDPPARPTISEAVPTERGDAFLLCSDGWWEPLHEARIEAALSGASDPEKWIACMAAEIALDPADRQDNYSALAVMVS